MSLAELGDAVGGRLIGGADPDTMVDGPVVIDSRAAQAGGVFFAVPGERVDGHDFADDARAAGSAAVVGRETGGPEVHVEDPVAALGRLGRAVADRLEHVLVVGVTGSSGKTSTKDLLAQVLESAGPTVAPIASLNNELGVPLTVCRADTGTRFLVVEMGARGPGHIRYLCEIAPPSVAVVLNVGAAHAGEFGGKEATAQSKGELVEALAPDGLAVLNADDPLVAAMSSRTAAPVVRFGRAPDADVRAEDVVLDDDGRAAFRLVTPAGTADVRLGVVGEHQVSNALAAAAVGLAAGLGVDAVALALSSAVARSRWRMEVTERADGVTVVNDAYNANPDSVAAALRSLARLASTRSGRSWAVLGEMRELGADAAAEHAAAGKLAADLGIDRVVAVSAAAAEVATAAQSAREWSESPVMVTDAAGALALLAEQVRPGDVVLVKASRLAALETVAAGLLEVVTA